MSWSALRSRTVMGSERIACLSSAERSKMLSSLRMSGCKLVSFAGTMSVHLPGREHIGSLSRQRLDQPADDNKTLTPIHARVFNICGPTEWARQRGLT